jgi:hypothetical protein
MTVPVQANRNSHQGNGVSIAFAYTWYYLLPTDLVVLLSNAETGLPILPQPILDSDYSVTPNAGNLGATITFMTAPASGTNIVIFGNPPESQQVSLLDGGILPSAAIETALDKTILVLQRTNDLISRMPQIADTWQNWTNNQIIPVANYLLAFDSNAENIVTMNPSDIANPAFVYASIFKDDYVANVGGQFSFIPGVTTQLLLRQDPIIANNTIIAFDNLYINKSMYSVSGDVVTFSSPIPDSVNIVEINMNAVVLGMNAPGADTVNTNAYITGSITARAIAAQTITATQIANLTITGAQIANSTITGAQIADNSIPPSKLTFTPWGPWYISNLDISPGSSPTTEYNVSAGYATDITNSVSCTAATSIINKSVALTWALGASAGAVVAADFPLTIGETCHIFEVWKADTVTFDSVASTDITGANVLADSTISGAGFIYARRVGSTYVTGTGTIRPINMSNGLASCLDNAATYAALTTGSSGFTLIALPIPAMHCNAIVHLNWNSTGNGNGLVLPFNSTVTTLSSTEGLWSTSYDNTGNFRFNTNTEVQANSSGQVGFLGSDNTAVSQIYAYGWRDLRQGF